MKHLILPFQCIALDVGKYLLAARKGVVRIDFPAIYHAAEEIHRMGWGNTISPQQFDLLLANLDPQQKPAAVAYLCEIGVVREVHQDHGRFHGIWLMSVAQAELASLAADIGFFTGLPCAAIQDADRVGDNDLVVLYTPQHDMALIHHMQQCVRSKPNSALLTCYFVGRNIVIDGLYLPAAFTPCHFCQNAGYPGSRLPAGLTAALKAISEKPPLAGLDYPIRATDHALCAGLLRNRVREIAGPHAQPVLGRSLVEMCQFSLDGYQLQREIPHSSRECEFCSSTMP